VWHISNVVSEYIYILSSKEVLDFASASVGAFKIAMILLAEPNLYASLHLE